MRGIEPCVKNWVRPITLARHAYGDVYRDAEMRIPGPGTVELSSANGWTSTWTGLAEYQGGHKVSYAVEEASVPDGYTSSVKPRPVE